MSVRELTISSTEIYEAGADFGDAGPYELVRGVAHIDLDLEAPANARVVDLAAAPRDERGNVQVAADVVLLRPVDPRRGNASLLYTVANRGEVSVPLTLGAKPARRGPGGALPSGDGFLLRQGWTLAWSGWQFDVRPGAGRVAIEVPPALRDGAPISGRTRVQFAPAHAGRSRALADWTASLAGVADPVYPAAEPLDQPGATLTVRETPDGPRRVIDRDRWRFARDEAGVPRPDPGHVRLDDGFVPGLLYEVIYTTAHSPVVGCGLAAVRDLVAHLRDREMSEHVVGLGVSQSGRFLRQFLYEGLNVDERGRRVFDGVFCHLAGARRGEFNHRHAMPGEAFAPGFGDLPPFAPAGLLERQRHAGGIPKLVAVNSSWEYWRGDAALGHIHPDGTADLPEPAGTRTYMIAGSDHVGDTPGIARMFDLANPENGLDHTPVARALLVALHAWLTDGTPPPASRVPRLEDGTAVPREEVLRRVERLPGLGRPDPNALPRVPRVDLGPDAGHGIGTYPPRYGDPYPCLVAGVDTDGNETSGIALPENAVPIATRTGWNTSRPEPGRPRRFGVFAGSRVPFPRDPDPADPRKAVSDRYADRADYRRRVVTAAHALVRDRLLLPDDLDHVIDAAMRRYDNAVEPTAKDLATDPAGEGDSGT
jgi:hypothetical protein